MSLIMADSGARGRSKRQSSLLRKQLAVAVRSVQWSYAIFWSSSSPTQAGGVLEWGEGCYNGDHIKKRKKRYEAHHKYGLQRSKQLRKLYLSMLEGDNTSTASITHDDDQCECNDGEDPKCNGTSMMLSPDDLSDEEWYYVVSMSYVFSPSQCLPGRALATGETIWLCNAHYAENRVFSRSLLARSASIQTVVCFPYLGGVIELGVTELISEDHSLIQHIISCLSKPDFSLNNFSAQQDNRDEKKQMRSAGDEDLHYKRTLSAVLKHAAADRSGKNDTSIHQPQPPYLNSCSSSFLQWKQHDQLNSNLHTRQSKQQNALQKILHDVPLMHTTRQRSDMNQDDPSDRSKENEKFSVLGTMVPTVKEVDKESILNSTIKYLQELEARVEELESCMGSVNFVEERKSLNGSVLIEETSGNYDDDSRKIIIDGNSGESKAVRDETHLRVKLRETQVVIEVRCCYRDYIVAEIMETLSNLHMDAFSVRSHTLDGFLTFHLKAKFRGAAVVSVEMIKRELRRVIADRV